MGLESHNPCRDSSFANTDAGTKTLDHPRRQQAWFVDHGEERKAVHQQQRQERSGPVKLGR